MAGITVQDMDVASVVLYKPLPLLFRLDVLPFGLLYLSCLYVVWMRRFASNSSLVKQAITTSDKSTEDDEDLFVIVLFAWCVFCHGMAFLVGEWSVDLKCWMGYTHVTSFSLDKYNRKRSNDTLNDPRRLFVKVVPVRNTWPKQICECFVGVSNATTPTDSSKPPPASEVDLQLPVMWFAYQKIVFCIGSDATATKMDFCFRRLQFPTQKRLVEYQKAHGFVSEQANKLALLKYGPNDFDIPIPTFFALLKEQLVAPFFVFQFFCMLLWCLDEYVYYSLMTLMMLVVFECTVVKQRQRNMEMLNQMRRAPQRCFVFRQQKWQTLWSDQLVPGDLVSIGHSHNDAVVPCDALLLSGTCVVNESMLSGESTPFRKEEVDAAGSPQEILDMDDQKHKKHVVFGGTRILQHSSTSSNCANALGLSSSSLAVPLPPDQGCVGFVLRTGFGTTQGSLMRTILFASQRVTANNLEAMWFILLLLCFAIVASGSVLHQALQDPSRNRFKLLLHCIMIITSVVPPELPMELSLAVTNSLVALTKLQIFCTEPFRIPFAGRIDFCCFDKTGTLTSDELTIQGVVGLKQHVERATTIREEATTDDKQGNMKMIGELDLVAANNLPLDTELILAGCHALTNLRGELVGDPIEKAAVTSIHWSVVYGDKLMRPTITSSRQKENVSMEIIHRFAFSSDFKRMSTVVQVNENGVKHTRVLCKGAPETMEPLFARVPTFYQSVYDHFATKGYRVLALGFRVLPSDFQQLPRAQQKRDEMEQRLVFAGFLVLNCPLKDDTKRTIRDLINAQHHVLMVTGDSALTACDVARQVGIMTRNPSNVLVLNSTLDKKQVEWHRIDALTENKQEHLPFDMNQVKFLVKKHDLCVTGDALIAMKTLALTQIKAKAPESSNPSENDIFAEFMRQLQTLCGFIKVFARTSPQQKEHVMMALNRSGKVTAMCGDGTNDVGALKQAHVGISIINNPQLEQMSRTFAQERAVARKNKQVFQRPSAPTAAKSANFMQELQQYQDSALEEELQVVRLGDASIASPFTSKSSSIRVTKELIRQGRCTLVTTIQMYKILGVNCLVTAYYLSALYLLGVKNGDQQLTIIGLAVAMFFLFLSRARPAKKLSKQRPPPGVFQKLVMTSILGQFGIHLVFLMLAMNVCEPFLDPSDPSMHPDGKFSPNVINSVVFLVSAIMQINTFIANYQGAPFMESIYENKLLYRSAAACYCALLLSVWEVFPPINELLELVPFPNAEIQMEVFCVMLGDTVATFAYEWLLSMLEKRIG